MSRSTLKFLAALVGVLIVVVPFAGLDDLPRSLRTQVAAERTALASAQTSFQAGQDETLGDLRSDPELFAAVPASSQWPDQLSSALGDLNFAARDMDELARLAKQNHRSDRQKVETLLAQERSLRTSALAKASSLQKEAAHWVDLKRHLPETLQQMDQDHGAIESFNLAALSAGIQKAETDWPDKRADLDARLASLGDSMAQSEQAWRATADARRAAAAGDLAHADIGAVVSAADQIHTTATALPTQADTLRSLSAQLYVAWDKILADMEVRHHLMSREYAQEIRTVRTEFADAAAKSGQTTSDDKWVVVPKATYEAMQNDLGMAIEHKSPGKYDTEAERVAQPAGFAYMAPPSVGSNQYGYWDHRDGRDFWVFYGQYALMRDLLFNHDYRPLDRYEWEGYRTYQSRGQTYYGGDREAPRYGTAGSATQSRYSGSTFAKGGGFKDSKYASKGGSFSSSKYASPSGAEPPRRFGTGASAPPARTYRPPSPRPSFRVPSAPRRFGRR